MDENPVSSNLLTCFPNDPKKHIDYVILYKEFSPEELGKSKRKLRKSRIRELFFEKLKKESFDIYYLSFEDENEDKFVYALLHCATDRLLEQANKLNFELKLKNCRINDLEEINSKKSSFSHKFKENLEKIKNDLDSEHHKSQLKNGNVISAVYDPIINYMFEGVGNEKTYPMGPLTDNLRALLVDNMLNNLTFLNDQESLKFKTETELKNLILKNKSDLSIGGGNKINDKSDTHSLMPVIPSSGIEQINAKAVNACKGLIYMIQDKYFEDAFTIHTESESEVDFMNQLIKNVNERNREEDSEKEQLNQLSLAPNERQHLFDKWAKLRRMMFFQPLWEIRDYFGEVVTFHYAWIGIFISTLWVIALVGAGFCAYGLKIGIEENSKTVNTTDVSATAQNYFNVFLYSFDNNMMPYFSGLLILWGCFFTEYWCRKQSKLAFSWDTENFNEGETDLPEYYRKKEARKDAWACTKKIHMYENTIKKFFSFIVLLIMVGLVLANIAGTVLFRIYVTKIVYPNDTALSVIFGSLGSILISTFITTSLNIMYGVVARKTTYWENPRTKTDFQNNLIFKLFIFNFVNHYGPLIYLAYFRSINYENGYFGLGKEYTDACPNDYCTPLLTTSIITSLVVKPMAAFGTSIVLPRFMYKRNLKQMKKKLNELLNKQEDGQKIDNQILCKENYNENLLKIYLDIEQKKNNTQTMIEVDGYIEKTTLYGLMIMFGNVFSLAPLVVLITLLVNIRLSAKSLLRYHRRIIGHKAESIGAWIYICRFLNLAAIFNLSAYTALKSNWSKTGILNNSDSLRYICIVISENGAFFMWLLIVFVIPAQSQTIKRKIRQQKEYVQKVTTLAREIENNSYDEGNRFNLNNDEIEDDSDESEDEESNSPIQRKSKKVHPEDSNA